MAQVEKHVPVLLNETLDALAVKPAGRYVDGTFGRGGHSRAIAGRGGEILGIDRDDDAIASAGELKVVKGCHGDLERIVRANGWMRLTAYCLISESRARSLTRLNAGSASCVKVRSICGWTEPAA